MDEPDGFEAFIAHQDGCVVVKVRGELDMASAPALEAVIDAALQASRHLVLDVADVTFMDSTGLDLMISTQLRLKDEGSVTIRNAPPVVLRVLALSGMESVLSVEP